MCGIVGTYGHELAEPEFRSIVGSLAHRGPDASGQLFDARHMVWLGHRRLSIIDLSADANQPFELGDLAITYNGEIYNYLELRAELEAAGSRFRTASDTEVVLEGWRRWGAAVLHKLRGMFAFAILDRASGELVLARDPLGIKPLFFWHDPDRNRLAFASELKALRRIPGFAPEIDHTALAATLLFDWIPEQLCIFAGVTKLAAGSYLTFGPRGMTVHSYWQPELAFDPSAPTCSIQELADVIEDSVRAHMVADVDLGVMLSGGLDSSLVTAIAARHDHKLQCFTIGFRAQDKRLEAMPDDLLYARRLAAQLHLPLREVEVTPDVASMLPRMVDILDEPIGDAAAINVLLICEAARAAGIKVMLSGMGADEIFGGYRRHLACLLAAHYRRLPAWSRSALTALLGRLPVGSSSRGYLPIRWAKRFERFASLPEEAAYRRSYTYYDLDELDHLLDGHSGNSVESLRALHEDIYWRATRAPGRDAQLARMCMTDLHLFLPSLNLAYTDRASMAASVEVRVPFVDPLVVASAFRLRGDDRIRGRVQKRALKQIAERWLPRALVHRPKSAFGMPLRAWTTRDLRDLIRDQLPSGQLVERGHLDGTRIRALIDENERGHADHAQAIWQLLTLEYWMQAHAL